MKNKIISLLPCGIFIFIFLFLNFVYKADSINSANFAIFAAIVALIVSIFTFQKNESFNDRIEVFIEGSSQPKMIHLCYIFF